MQNFIDSKLLVPVSKDGTKKYVDDNLSGGTEEEVDKMIGDIQIVTGKYSYTGFVASKLKQGMVNGHGRVQGSRVYQEAWLAARGGPHGLPVGGQFA